MLLVADAGLPERLARDLAPQLAEDLDGAAPAEAPWSVAVESGSFPPGAELGELTPRVRAEADQPGWDFVLGVTDLPPTRHRGDEVVELDAERRTGIVSVPALGGVALRRRARRAMREAVVALAEGGVGPAPLRDRRCDRVRLLAGMVRANRPWRLVAGLGSALAAAFAAGAFVGINGSMWAVAAAVAPWRLALASVLSVAVFVVWLIVRHDLWERGLSGIEDEDQAPHPRERRLRNASTVVTLVVGVLVGYAGIFAALLVGALVILDGETLSEQAGAPAEIGTYLRIAWLAASAATVAGAVGSSLEDERAAEQAAYGRRERRRREVQRRQRAAREDGD